MDASFNTETFCQTEKTRGKEIMSSVPGKTKKFSSFSSWFDDLVMEAKILDARYPVKGFIVYRENGFRAIKNIERIMEDLLHETGHEAVNFPDVISEDMFAKEAEHIKGFTTEVFWIERGGGSRLERRLILRPTSETAMYPMFPYWIRSHADLPFKIHQSVPVYRYETKATRPLLRLREFLWNEGHTAHATAEDAERQVKEGVDIYQHVYNEACLSYILLKRPDFDKFPGAEYSLAFDTWNPDGKVNQIGTVHNLGTNFAKVFNIMFEDKDGARRHVHQTCYGAGYTRILAAIIAQHGDDHGCVFPPAIAPIQVIVIPIVFKEKEQDIIDHAKNVYESIRPSFRAAIDEREDITPGEKFYYWEKMGVPIRVEVGPKEMESGILTVVRRDTLERHSVQQDQILERIQITLDRIKENLKVQSAEKMKESIADARSKKQVATLLAKRKIARIQWCGSQACAEDLTQEVAGEIRGTRADIEETPEDGCLVCGGEAKAVAYVARAY